MHTMPAHNSPFFHVAQYLVSIGLCPVLLAGKKPIFSTYTEYLAGPPGKDELALPLERRPLRYTDDLLRAWGTEYPHANVGMLTRERPSIDIDAPHIWEAICDLVPPTPHVKRGKKGFTLIYSQDPADPVRRTRTFVDPFRRNKPDAMLLEVLAEGRQTVLPPSIHPDTGFPYEWIPSPMPAWGFLCPVPLSAELPPSLSQAVVDAIEARLSDLGLTRPRAERGTGLARAITDGERRRYEAFMAPKLRERLEAVRGAVSGIRQDTLNGAVYALAPWVREGFITEDWLEGQMREACMANGYIQEDGDKAFTRQFAKALDEGWAAELPDLDSGRAAQLMGQSPLAATVPAMATATWAPADLEPRLVSELLTHPVPVREWTVQGWIPHKQITLLYGDGGAGKTTLLMQLAITASRGGMWFGQQLKRRKVLFITAEDEIEELHYRLDQMTRLMGRDVGDFTVISLANLEICELMMLDGSQLKPTDLFEKIRQTIMAQVFDLVILDPIADLFGGNEIDKKQVTKFMRFLRKHVAFDLACSVIVAAHPSSDGMKTGKGTSGSNAWSNSSRARLYFTNNKDTGISTLELMKANRGKAGDTISMKWTEGVFVQVASEANTIISADVEVKIMDRLERENFAWKWSDRSPNWVGFLLELEMGEKLATPDGKRKVRKLLDGWEKAGFIKKHSMRDKDHRNITDFVEFVAHPSVRR